MVNTSEISICRLFGEIIKKDDNLIVVKVNDKLTIKCYVEGVMNDVCEVGNFITIEGRLEGNENTTFVIAEQITYLSGLDDDE